MGLDITAYTKLTEDLLAERDAEGEPVDENYGVFARSLTIDWTEMNWPGRTAGLKRGAIYEAEDSHGFRAGSYGGYNAWRDWLARVAGFASAKFVWDNEINEGPFVELIHFADNEGIIGSVVSAKLAKDFAAYEDKAAKASEQPFYIEAYRDWRKAFEMAADNGAVEFH